MSEYDDESDYEQLIHSALLHKHTQREVHPPTSTAPRFVLRDIGAPVTAVHVSDRQELYIGTQHGLVAQYSLQSYRRASATHLPQQRASVMSLEEDNSAHLYSTRFSESQSRDTESAFTELQLFDTSFDSQARDGTVQLYDLTAQRALRSLNTLCETFCKGCVGTNQDGVAHYWVTSSSADSSRVVLWSLNSDESLQCLPDHTAKYGMCMATRMHATANNSSTLVAGTYESGHVLFWDVRQTQVPLTRALVHEPSSDGSAVSGLCFDWQSDTCQGVAGGTDAQLVSFALDVSRAECHVTDRRVTGVKGGTAVVRFDRSLTRVITGGWDHVTRVWSWPLTRVTPVTLKHAASVTDLALARDSTLAVATNDGHVTLWSL